MRFNIWLDDVRPAPKGYIHFYDAETLIDFLECVGICHVTKISFDHDLGENVPTGYDVLKWIEKEVADNTQYVPEMIIHSANPVGRKNMEAAIESINRLGF